MATETTRRALAVFTLALAANLPSLSASCRAATTAEAVAESGAVTLRLRAEGETARLELTGLPAGALAALAEGRPDAREWAKFLALRVAGSDDGKAPPVLGAYRVADGVVRFAPRFPLRAGVEYRAAFDPAGLPGGGSPGLRPLEVKLSLARDEAAPATAVAAVYPTGNELPENLLKFYIHFSAPMSRGGVYRRLRLIDDAGRDVVDPFLEIGEELWDPAGTRLTVLFDPGRIKRGLKPREELGPPLVEGRRYTLVIAPEWRDAAGLPLSGEYRREFSVTAPDDAQPDPERWQVSPPAAGTREPLVVEFDEPLDHAMLEHVIEASGPDGKLLEGSVLIGPNETSWSFRPAEPWPAGNFHLNIDAALEDRAGNSVGRRFEVDGDAAQGAGSEAARSLPFEIN